MEPLLYLQDSAAEIPSGTKIGTLGQLPDHGGMEICLNQGDCQVSLLVQAYQGQVYIYENSCPHARHPLNLIGSRFLDINGTALLCRSHGARFTIDSGKCTAGPCKGTFLRPVAFEVRGDDIYSL